MRTLQHIIDTKAVRKVINSIPEYCVVRELTERDYGIDLMIELFEKKGENEHGHPIYDTSGHICYLQIKGTDSALKSGDDNSINYNIKKQTLLYVEKFSTPFILTRVCTLTGKESIHFVWLQRYISDKLDLECPNWRTRKEDSLTIKIPIINVLPDRFDKIERIAWQIKYIEEISEYHEKYSELELAFSGVIQNPSNIKLVDYLIKGLNRISHLSTLLTKNQCCIDKNSVLELQNYLIGIREGTERPREMDDFPNYYNMSLLKTSNLFLRAAEEFVAEVEGDIIY